MNINLNNYEDHFIAFAEGILNEKEREEVTAFAAKYPELKKELELYQKAKAKPEAIIYPYKASLKKSNVRPLVNRQIYMAAAAIALLLMFWLPFQFPERDAVQTASPVKIAEPQNIVKDVDKQVAKKEIKKDTPSLAVNPVKQKTQIINEPQPAAIKKELIKELPLEEIEKVTVPTPPVSAEVKKYFYQENDFAETGSEKEKSKAGSILAGLAIKIFDINIRYNKEAKKDQVITALSIQSKNFKFYNQTKKEL